MEINSHRLTGREVSFKTQSCKGWKSFSAFSEEASFTSWLHLQTSLSCLKFLMYRFVHLSLWRVFLLISAEQSWINTPCRLSEAETSGDIFLSTACSLWPEDSCVCGCRVSCLQVITALDVMCISSDCLCREACLLGQKCNTRNTFLPRSINSLTKNFTADSRGNPSQCAYSGNCSSRRKAPLKPPTLTQKTWYTAAGSPFLCGVFYIISAMPVLWRGEAGTPKYVDFTVLRKLNG